MIYNYKIKYKHTNKTTIKIDWSNNTINITIPYLLILNQKIKNDLIKKWNEIYKEYIKKKILINDWSFFYIFWEKKIIEENDLVNIFIKECNLIINLYSEKIWVKHKWLKVKYLTSKWWSCSYDNNISLNLYLLHIPKKYLEYVIIHELCHIIEKNHSNKFWKLVEKFYPEYKEVRKSLKEYKI